MSKFLNVPYGDYTISVQDGGTIRLDTGNAVGNVVITGDLYVQGETTEVNTTTMTVEDNVITLNSGEQGSGVSDINNRQSGLEIDRGSKVNAYWFWNEEVNWTSPLYGPTSGLWVAAIEGNVDGTGDGYDTTGIQTNQIYTNGGDLYLINAGQGVISVTGSSNYERQVFYYNGGSIDIGNPWAEPSIPGEKADPDNIPNAQAVVDYVDAYFASVFQDRIEENDTFVETKDFTTTGQPSVVEVGVDNVVRAKFYSDRIELDGIAVDGTTIRPSDSDNNLFLEGTGAGEIVARDLFSIEKNAVPPTYAVDRLKLYVDTEDTGGTGLFFVNTSDRTDEIISNNRALVYSMLF